MTILFYAFLLFFDLLISLQSFLAIILFILGTNFYYYIKTGKHLIEQYMGKIFHFLAKFFKFDIFKSPYNIGNINLLNNTLINQAKNNKLNNKISNDKMRTRTRLNNNKKAGGYCYIGEENGYRSCTRVDNKSKYMSKQLYPTMDMCKKLYK